MDNRPKVYRPNLASRSYAASAHQTDASWREACNLSHRGDLDQCSTLRVRFIGGTPTEQTVARQQAEWWAQMANLKFYFNNALNAEIRIAFDRNDGAWSYVGADCRGIPLDQPTMNLRFLDGGTAGHEFGIPLDWGLAHEYQKPAREIQWNEALVIREAAKSPNFWDEATTGHEVFGNGSL